MGEERREKLATLYDELVALFELGWGQHGHQAVHFGYFDDDHADTGAAIRNMTRQLADEAGIDEGDRVLDMGCGAGGDAVWLAEHRGAEVVGVDLVVDQLERGQQAAQEAGVADRVTYWRDDFHELVSVDDGSIDVAWALESLSHSTERDVAMERVREVLAPDGRLAVGDVFLRKSECSEAERELLDEIERNMGLRFVPLERFEDTLRDAGFRDVETLDVTAAVLRGEEASIVSEKLVGPVSKIGSAIGLGTDAQAQYFDFLESVYKLLGAKTAGYFFVTARPAEANGEAADETTDDE